MFHLAPYRWRKLLVVGVTALATGLVGPLHRVTASPVTEQAATTSDAALADDATLHDVFFVDAQTGWAVGGHGVVLGTRDGGQHWHQQPTAVQATLRGVWFEDALLGWAVGGTINPYQWTSEAVVLRTADGGRTWRPQTAIVPALDGVRFFDHTQGLAWGSGSGGEPCGIFATEDGGRNWHAIGNGPRSDWVAADFVDPQTGLVAGASARVARLIARELKTIATVDKARRPLRAAKILPPADAWLAGDRGLILHSSDAGARWHQDHILPDALRDSVSWRTIAGVGDHLWLAGSPGTVVLHSPDRGATWQGHATGVTTPIHKLHFVDENQGWAVGSLGTILHTTDGGRSWNTQRGGDRRAAVLGIFTQEDEIPFEALAKLGRDDGYRVAVHLLTAPDEQNHEAASSLEMRLEQATSLLGVNGSSISWQFRRPPSQLGLTPSQTVAAIERHVEGRLQDRMLETLVRQIRMWQPRVVIVPRNESKRGPLAALAEEVAIEAIERAADPAYGVELAEGLNLLPWQVDRVFASLTSGDRGTHRIESDAVVPLAGRTLAELATDARGLMTRRFAAPPAANEFLLLMSRVGEPAGHPDDLLTGLAIASGTSARRSRTPPAYPVDLAARRRLAEQRHNLSQLVRTTDGNAAWLAQIRQITGDMDVASAGQLTFELAEEFRGTGQLELAAETLELLVERYPSHPLTDHALVWLVHYYASGEMAYVHHKQGHPLRPKPLRKEEDTRVEGGSNHVPLAERAAEEEVLLATAVEEPVHEVRLARATTLAEQIAQSRPLLYADPAIRFPWTVAQRLRGQAHLVEPYLDSLSLRAAHGGWSRCAQAEKGLEDQNGNLRGKNVVVCRVAAQRPHLDGELNEPLWQHAEAVPLSSSANGETWDSQLRLAYDEEFLYLAIRSEKAEHADYAHDDTPRRYDADLSGRDRLRLCLDVDRDYVTYYELTLDHRGWTGDACWQSAAWNPRWYVASDSDAQTWRVEAAIAWQELSWHPPAPGTAWALAADRRIPTVAAGSLAGPLFDQPGPENFVLLLFEDAE